MVASKHNRERQHEVFFWFIIHQLHPETPSFTAVKCLQLSGFEKPQVPDIVVIIVHKHGSVYAYSNF